jgi:hypothetical protein
MAIDLTNKEDINLVYRIAMIYFIGYLVTALFFEGLFSINYKISLLIYAIINLGDILIQTNYLLKFINWIVKNR